MKYRSDFVTNSSSSSYLVYSINSKTLYDIVKSFKEELEEIEKNENKDFDYEYSLLNSISLNPDNCVCLEGEYYTDIYAETLEELVVSLIDLLKDCMYGYGYGDYDENGEFKADENYKDKIDLRFISAVEDKKDSILEDVNDLSIVSSDIGWGGDDDTRYDPSSYDDDTLEEMYQNIAEGNGISIDEARERDDLFAEYVGSKTSVSETTYKYNFGAQVVEDSYSYSLED